jgi:hypothetical protein
MASTEDEPERDGGHEQRCPVGDRHGGRHLASCVARVSRSHGATLPTRVASVRSHGGPERGVAGNTRRRRPPARRDRPRRRRLDVARPSRCPDTGGAPRLRRQRRPAAVPAPLHDPSRPRGGTPPVDHARRRVLPGRRLARRRLPRRSRGVLRPPLVRRHRARIRIGDDTSSPSRSPARRRTPPRQAQHHRRLSRVLGRHGRTWNPGGLWRPGAGRRHRTGPDRPVPGALPRRRQTRAHLLLSRRLDSDASRRSRIRHVVSTASRSPSTSTARGRRNEVAWSLDIDDPALWWPRSARRSAAHRDLDRHRDRRRGERRRQSTHRAASGRVEQLVVFGQRRAALPEGRQPLPTRGAGRRERRGAARRRARCRGTGSTPSASTATSPGPSLRRGRRARPPRPPGLPPAVGVRPLGPGPAVVAGAGRRRPLGHHPSIVQWNAHDDPDGATASPADTPAARLRDLAPTSCRRGTDGARPVGEAVVRAADPTRPCVPHSGVLPHLPQLDGTDSHLSFGWGTTATCATSTGSPVVCRASSGSSRSSARRRYPTPRLPRPDRWPDLDWDTAGSTTAPRSGRVRGARAARRLRLVRRVAPRDPGVPGRADPHHVETLRRLKYRPTGGFCMFALNDPAPVVSFVACSTTNGARSSATGRSVDACAPVIVVADRPPAIVVTRRRHLHSTCTS